MALHFETPENFQTMLIINILIIEIHVFISNRDFPILFLFETIKTQMREFISICMTSHFTFANQIQMIENIRFSSFFKLKYFFRRDLNWIKFISSFRQLCDLDFNLFIYIYVIRMGENQTSGRFSSHFATSNDATHRQRQMQTEDSGVRRYVTQESSSSST